MLKIDRNYLFHLGHMMMWYYFPSPVYSIYFKGQLVSLLVSALVVGSMSYINTIN